MKRCSDSRSSSRDSSPRRTQTGRGGSCNRRPASTAPSTGYFEGDFQQYAESEYPTIATQGPIGTNFDGNKKTAVSTYWHGKATTVANDWYDVRAGSDVEILILNTALVTEGGVPTVVGGAFAEAAFAGQYGPLAKIQADGMKHIVTAFLEGML